MLTNDAYCTFMNICDSVTKHGSAVTLCAEPPSRLVAKGLERLESRSVLSHFIADNGAEPLSPSGAI